MEGENEGDRSRCGACISWDLLLYYSVEMRYMAGYFQNNFTMNNHWRDYQNSISLKNVLYYTNLIILAIVSYISNVIESNRATRRSPAPPKKSPPPPWGVIL
jgi:hypothetical protein